MVSRLIFFRWVQKKSPVAFPVYETIAGWTDSTVGVTEYDKLPVNARRYLERIQDVTGVPIAMISTSPDRDHTILMHNPYAAQ